MGGHGDEVTEATYANGKRAEATTDALELFLNEISRYPLLSAAESPRRRRPLT